MEVKNEFGCGFMAAFLSPRAFKPRKTVMATPYQDFSKPPKPRPEQAIKPPVDVKPKRSTTREKGVADAARTSSSSSSNTSGSNKASQLSSSSNTSGSNKVSQLSSSSNTSGSNKVSKVSSSSNTSGTKRVSQVVNGSYTKKLNEEPTFSSNELSLTLADQRKVDTNGTLFRGSSGNVMLLGHLGNLKQGKVSKDGENVTAKKVTVEKKHQYGNIFNNSMYRSNSEVLKSLGNEKYKQGEYEEALALYNQAIAIDPTKACYYSNKSAALIGLGRVLEAVVQCREAIRIDSSYHNAHYRLGSLYFRLGLPDKAVYHYKCSGYKASFADITQAEALKTCVRKCIEAQSREDWNRLHFETQDVFSRGADSATVVYAMKSEALLKLHRHEEAYAAVESHPCFGHELNSAIFGSSATAELLAVRAQVYMSSGRIEDAVSDVQQAFTLDSSSKMSRIAEQVKTVASARSKGNRLFKGSRITEALVAYNEGLENDPRNSILLCNRAACRSKLGQYEKAVEDCAAALAVRPNYRKARLRRANCNAALERWEAAIQDYEILMQEKSKDDEEEVRAALSNARTQCNQIHYKDKYVHLAATRKLPENRVSQGR